MTRLFSDRYLTFAFDLFTSKLVCDLGYAYMIPAMFKSVSSRQENDEMQSATRLVLKDGFTTRTAGLLGPCTSKARLNFRYRATATAKGQSHRSAPPLWKHTLRPIFFTEYCKELLAAFQSFRFSLRVSIAQLCRARYWYSNAVRLSVSLSVTRCYCENDWIEHQAINTA